MTPTLAEAFTPAFVPDIAEPYAMQPVRFANVSTGGNPAVWAWDFGDGETATEASPTHAFAAPGVYPVTLTAFGETATLSVTVRSAVVYNGIELSEIGPYARDYAPVCREKECVGGGISLQGSLRLRNAWEFICYTDSLAEVTGLDALVGQRLTLNIDGALYGSVMIREPFDSPVGIPGQYFYTIGFVQETGEVIDPVTASGTDAADITFDGCAISNVGPYDVPYSPLVVEKGLVGGGGRAPGLDPDPVRAGVQLLHR